MKIGLFFGSFNPIHIGHLIIANVIHNSSDCKEIWFVVSPQNPFKPSQSLAHEQDRYDMVQAAINEDYCFRVSDVEFQMPKPSYTVDTLAYLSAKNEGKEFKLIIGSDNLKSFHKWKNHQVILDQYGLLVYPRQGEMDSPLLEHKNVEVIESPLLNISASYIRKQIREGKSVKYLLPTPVIDIIDNRHLFGH